MSNFGATFRKAREAAGLPLEKIAAETRISTRFLLAIESEDFHLLPGGIFNRGFVRAYAAHLGLDPDQAVADYSRVSAASDEPLEVLRDEERASTRRAERSLYPIAAAILIILVVLYYIVNRGPSAKPPAPPAPVAAAQETPSPPAEAANAPIETPPEPTAVPAATPSGQPAPPNGPALTAAPASTAPASTPAPVLATPKPPAVADQSKTTASNPAASTLVLDVDVKEATWVHITADGTVALNDTLSPGATRRIAAEKSIDITLGNAGGASLKINGRDIGPLGGSGKVRELKITPENASRIQ